MSLGYAEQKVAEGKITVANPAVAETVTLGWSPRYVRAVNINNLSSYEFFYGMTAGTSLDMGNHDTTQVSVNAADGITLTSTGFTLGTDICDTAADVVYYIAIR